MSSLAESPFIQQQLQSREWMREQQEEHKAYAAYVFHPLHELKQRTCRVRVHASVPQNTNKLTRVFFFSAWPRSRLIQTGEQTHT